MGVFDTIRAGGTLGSLAGVPGAPPPGPVYQPQETTYALPSGPGGPMSAGPSTGGRNAWDGLSGFALANHPDYVRQQVTEALTRRNQQYGKPAPTAQEIEDSMRYVLTPDVYGDGMVRSGWSPYWADRFGTPGAEGASGADRGGADTLVQGGGMNGAGGFSSAPNGPLASFSAPGLLAPWTQQFQAPDPNTIKNDPYYQFQLGEGNDAIQRSAAAKGTLLTGGTLKDMQNYAQGLASSFGDKAYNRAWNEWMGNRDTFWGNQNNAYNHLAGFTQLGLGGANQLGGYGQNYGSTYGENTLNQGQANAGATMGQNQNVADTGSTIANAAGGIDWSKIFKRAKA